MGACCTEQEIVFLEAMQRNSIILGDRNDHFNLTQQLIAQVTKVRKNSCFQPKQTTFHQRQRQGTMSAIYYLREKLVIGHIQDQQIHGDGVIVDRQSIYTGQLLGSKPEGKGKCYVFNNQIISEIKGIWRDGQLIDLTIETQDEINRLVFTSEGNNLQIVYKDGSTYTGSGIIRDKSILKHGHGLFTNPNTSYEYRGNWQHDKRNGEAQIFIDQRLVFSGRFKDDRKVSGTLTVGNFIYEGRWDEGGNFDGIRRMRTNTIENP